MQPSSGVLDLVSARDGHFQLESGYHSALWLDLDTLFIDPNKVAPLVSRLAGNISAHQPSVVCGPLVGGAFLAQLIANELGIEFCYTEKVGTAEITGLYQIEYALPRAFRGRVAGARVALVDDVMSAGSSLRATFTTLRDVGAIPVVVGALMVLGSKGEAFFRDLGVPVEAVERREYQVWEQAQCPLCASRVPIETTG
jgi:orotate phosphoribosyltransferase